ncbi:MAG: NmrA family NAD(P)-binding protein [Acidobacteria bacterium]|nr:NmrA family NAD(P)-binding protein [Acidobacteriota bacterium]
MIVITGATGNTGQAAADAVLTQGHSVTVVVRGKDKGARWEARGAKIAVADLGDADAMTKILASAGGAYLMVPPTMSADDFLADRRKVSDALAAAVKASGVANVALLSSVGGHLDAGTGAILTTHYSESVIGTAARNITIVRAAYFMENWASVLDAAIQHGVLPTFLTADRKIPMVATLDVGRVAAEALLHPVAGKRVIELSGPESYSPLDIAAALSDLLGKTVTAQQVPIEAMPATLEGFGFPKNLADLYQEMVDAINRDHVRYEGNDIRRGTVTPREVLAKLLKRASN